MTGERAQRLARIEKLFRTGLPAPRAKKASPKAIPRARGKAPRKAA